MTGDLDLLSLLVIALVSFLSGTVKTLMAYTRNKVFPKKLDFVVNIILAFFVGTLAGFVCSYFKVPSELLYVVVSLSALSAERLLSAIPTIFVKKVEDYVGVHPTQEDYAADPYNKQQGQANG